MHGAWADASSWTQVIPILLADGLPVVAVQLPLTSVEDDDFAATSRALADVKGPIVLLVIAGGMAVAEAGVQSKVAALEYVAAFAV